MEWSKIWYSYGFDRLEAKISNCFPKMDFSMQKLLEQIIAGDLKSVYKEVFHGVISGIGAQIEGQRQFLVWLLVLGMLSALFGHFSQLFRKQHMAEVTYWLFYLIMITILLSGFREIGDIAVGTVEKILSFIRILLPTYALCITVSTGSLSAGGCRELMLFVIFGVEQVLIGAVLPLIYAHVLLSAVNGIWMEEKLGFLIAFLERGIRMALKALLGIVTGISFFQGALLPLLDSGKHSSLQRVIRLIPGIGNAADSVLQLAIGSAVILKNSIGVLALILLIGMCVVPLLQILLTALLIKGASALLGIVSDRKLVACMNRIGEGGMLLFELAGTGMLLFLIGLSVVALSTGGRI